MHQIALKPRELEILRLMADGLTNREIAERLHIGVETVRTYAKQIYAKLEVSGRVQASRKAQALGLLTEAQEGPPPIQDGKHKLPTQLTPFIGRAGELSDLCELLEHPEVRLVTILAPGGMGKTRLAIKAAAQQVGHYQDGIVFIALQPLSDADTIVPAIAEALNLPFHQDDREPQQQLLDYLSSKQMLLVMDNWEHLLTGASLVADILKAAPGSKILTTSREKLNLSAEHVYLLRGMQFPTWETPADALEYDAVQLLVQSARRIKSDWEVTDANLKYVARICRLTAGMPLGIVLAASWLDMLPLHEIAAEIQQNVDFLAADMRDMPARQRSIRAVFDYTWQRLKPGEQQAFMKLSVFRGGFTRAAAQIITGSSLHTLQRLAEKALITRTNTDRYDIHELLRQYGAEQLADSNEAQAVCDAHSQHFLQWLAGLEADIKGQRQQAALNEVEYDFENIRAAWSWSVEQHNFAPVHEAAESLVLYCWMQGIQPELETMIWQANRELDQSPELERTWAHLTLCHQMTFVIQPAEQPTTHEELTRCLAIARQHNDQADEALCLLIFGLVEWAGQPDYQQAIGYFQQALEQFAASDNGFYTVFALNTLAYSAGSLGDIDQALDLFQQSLTLQREIGDESLAGFNLNNLGCTYGSIDAYEESIQALMDAITLPHHKKNVYNLSYSYAFLGLTYFLGGAFDDAQHHAAEGEQLGREVGYLNSLGVALTTLGLLASVASDYPRAEELARRALMRAEKSNHYVVPFASCSLALARCGLERAEEAVSIIQPLLKLPIVRNTIPQRGMVIAVIAVYMQTVQAYEQATHYLSFVLNADYKTFSWAKKWPLLQRLRADLRAQMDETTFNVFWEEGRRMSLDEVTEQIARDIE